MFRLGAISNHRMAQAFVDYMDTLGVELKLSPEGEGQLAIWLVEDQHKSLAEAEFQQFLENPNRDKYLESSWKVAESRTASFNYSAPGILSLVKEQAGLITLSVMVICIAVFSVSWLGFIGPVFSILHFPADVSESWQVWRWFSHGIIHFSTLHLVFNLVWWWVLGGRIEQRLGKWSLLQIFFVSAAFSGLAQYLAEGPNFGGLSGVVYALLGYVWMMGYFAPHKGVSIEKAHIGFMLVWLVIGFYEPMGMKIANIAHLAGLASGCVMGWLASRK
ncbi:rhomboid family intramembrane serine protease GlpG [Veronia pacifica]|uniref:Rhomboid family intramembrane serine protease GlpG n=1 Tax=Veronia pacifica TaxID=1080227 RepID=A0A1C3EJ53_9GAMM|nr:rhomboid family intramembrane serine protease GlpG [Veronia pacifica]ODA33260.1 rhomboid family intramembrane serine protease GlpG [Veronia pacifica]